MSTSSPCDFANSYMTFTVPRKENAARIQIDAVCRVTGDGANDGEFVLITPCKSENMYVESGLFKDPNYDFCGVFSRSEFQIQRTFATHDPARLDFEVDSGANSPRFESVKIDLRTFAKAESLKTDAAIVKATLANRHIIARLHLKDSTGKKAAVEYPVKTMNVAEPTQRFQTDTGPILVPWWIDPGSVEPRGSRPIEQFILAFISCNHFTGGDLVLRQPTKTDGPQVMHYSRVLPIPEATHEFFAV